MQLWYMICKSRKYTCVYLAPFFRMASYLSKVADFSLSLQPAPG